MRRSVAEAFVRDADYVAGAVRARGSRAARAAAHRLDDAFRQLLAERGAGRLDLESVGTLVAGAAALARAAAPPPRTW
jgi:hypothetical protein